MITAHKLGKIPGGGQYVQVRCKECGEEFHLPCAVEHYPFRKGQMFFCSWSCKRKYEASHKPKKSSMYLDYLT